MYIFGPNVRSDLDVRSLVLEEPGFTFLHSRELFVAQTAACEPVHDVTPFKAGGAKLFLP